MILIGIKISEELLKRQRTEIKWKYLKKYKKSDGSFKTSKNGNYK
jgi:hypothetical protein